MQYSVSIYFKTCIVTVQKYLYKRTILKIYKLFELLHYWIQNSMIFPNIDWLGLTSTEHWLPHCTFYWLPLYPTVPPLPHWKFLLISTVYHCTSLLSSRLSNCKSLYSALTSTVPLMYITAQSYWPALYPTVWHCTGHWQVQLYTVLSSIVTHFTPLYHKFER